MGKEDPPRNVSTTKGSPLTGSGLTVTQSTGLPLPMTTTTTIVSGTGVVPRRTTPSTTSISTSATVEERRVSWIYNLSKAEVQRELLTYGLDCEGKADELRAKLVKVYKEGPPKVAAQQGDAAASVQYQQEKERDRQEEDVQEGQLMRRILGLRPDALVTVVENILVKLKGQQDQTLTQGLTETRTREGTPIGGIDKWSLPQPTWTSRTPRLSTSPAKTQFVPASNPGLVTRSVSELCTLVRKWNLRFDGERDAISFMERLVELMEAYGVDPDDILKALPELMKDQALLWQRIHRETWNSFQDFRYDFERQFWPIGYQQSLEEEIRRRTQGAGEPFKQYMVAIITLIRRRGGYSEQEKLERIYSNLRPEYKSYVRRRDFADLRQLQQQAEEYETLLREGKSFHPPPDVAQALVPETAYRARKLREKTAEATTLNDWRNATRNVYQTRAHDRSGQPPQPYEETRRPMGTDPPRRNAWVSPRQATGPDATARLTTRRRDATAGLACWTCGNEGHLQRNCPSPPEVRCFYCKKPNVRTYECGCRPGNGRGTLEPRGTQSPE